MAHVFSGMRPYIEVASGAQDCDLGKTLALWHVGQLQTALGQLATQDRASQLQALEHITRIRTGLAAALEGSDLAILGVCKRLELPLPSYLKDRVPEARKTRIKEA